MADGINWGALQSRNVFADFAGGLEQGAELRRDRIKAQQQQDRQKAYNLFAKDPKGAETALMAAGDVEGAESLRKRREADETKFHRGMIGVVAQTKGPAAAREKAVQAGQMDMATQFGQLDEQQRKQARDNAEDLGGFALGIAGVPYEQRRQIIEQATPILLQKGFTQEQIAGFDPTDQNIQALAASAMDLKEALAERDRQADNMRADAQLEEARRSNRTREGISRGQLGVAQSNAQRGWAAHNARVKAGGYGTPGVGMAISDEDVEIDP